MTALRGIENGKSTVQIEEEREGVDRQKNTPSHSAPRKKGRGGNEAQVMKE